MKIRKRAVVDTAIVGAGPYGISLAMHLTHQKADCQIFGSAMETWCTHMPAGMSLKSEGCKSNIHNPIGFTLEKYSAEKGLPYQHKGLEVPLDTFVAYGMACHEHVAAVADPRQVTRIESDPSGFRLRLSDSECIQARRVVLAVGIAYYAFVPAEYKPMLSDHVTHSSAHSDVSVFAGKRLLVIGAGASATDLACLAGEAGADVTLICRSKLSWGVQEFMERPLRERLRYPEACPAPGVQAFLAASCPQVFRKLPRSLRHKVAVELAGPSGAWFLKERFGASVRVLGDTKVTDISENGEGLCVQLTSGASVSKSHADHVVFGTGYHTDLKRLDFLEPKLLSRVSEFKGAPFLSANFESSVPGMYFVGKSASTTFGPQMRFVCGTKYCTDRLGPHLVATAKN